ncbi:hypothetical protein SDC9_75907 [bioreactor metagenome]|uniref:Uncharacterized protein n=1 Tax=bioreactor metagenome TaxID=1076179 RepID=A0A644YM25_9ZZZZ
MEEQKRKNCTKLRCYRRALLLHEGKGRMPYMKIKKVRIKNVQGSPPMQSAKAMTDFSAEKTDPQGSYTGCPIDPEDVPVQDADDL